ncbi:MAG: type II toxin-antitoxin system RelE/ParE family toxin [Arcobacteraceae bacterium]|nr:type II toxin-antitoxin system RelE/ParE family toxin [Arcobacteraceae bacterium]
MNLNSNMQIKIDKVFANNFNIILEYIALDKITASLKFKNELFKQIKNIPNFPYKYRKSFYFNDINIRDMIFKGYTIVYEIDTTNNQIIVLNIFDKNKPPLS